MVRLVVRPVARLRRGDGRLPDSRPGPSRYREAALARLNAFDQVTVALGSTLATIVVNSSVSWVEAAGGPAALALLQSAVAWAIVRWPQARKVVTSLLAIVLRDGIPLEAAMRRERVSLDEIRQAVRASGPGASGRSPQWSSRATAR